MQYQEQTETTAKYKTQYAQQLNALLEKRQAEAGAMRAAYVRDIFKDPARYRKDLRQMLGWPLVDYEAKGLPTATLELTVFEGTHEFCRDDAPIARLVQDLY